MWRKDFIEINGFPNDVWGWGGEDDLLRDRIEDAHFRIQRVDFGSIYDLEQMTLEQKMNYLKENNLKCSDKWERRDYHRKHPGKYGYVDVEDYKNVGHIQSA